MRDHVSQYAPPLDIYAHSRCGCGHLVYANQVEGDRCLWAVEGLCNCVDHRPAVRAEVHAS